MEKISLNLEKEKETDAVGILRISERRLDVDEELYTFFIDWRKAFDLLTGPN